MNYTKTVLAVTALLVLLSPVTRAQQETQAEEQPVIVFAVYPDPAYTELKRVAEALAQGINHRTEFLKKAYADGREDVINGDAAGMLITKRMNKIRLEKASANRGEIQEPELTTFTPIARKLIKSKNKVLDEVILGIASVEETSGIKQLAQFAQSGEGAQVLNEIPYMAPLK